MPILQYKGKTPKISDDALIAQSATVIGDVEIEDEASVFPGAVLRGDVAKIRIGRCSNIQDNAVIHGGYIYDDGKLKDTVPVEIGDYVSITHGAILHGCKVESVSMIGVGSIIFDRSVIGTGSIVGMGTVILEGTIVPERSIIAGVPGKIIRKAHEEDYSMVKNNALMYRELAKSLTGVLF
ncbi:MAG: gamma carbonic anhydrase family protein [Candidatus Bathyarchaeia archaeon]